MPSALPDSTLTQCNKETRFNNMSTTQTFLDGWTPAQLRALNRAQAGNAKLYRRYWRVSPWNSKTRKEWQSLAVTAERLAKAARQALKETEGA